MLESQVPPPIHLCIGAPRSGTTWLAENMRLQDSVFTPLVKEVRYWCSRRSNVEAEGARRVARQTLSALADPASQECWLQRWSRIDRDSPPQMEEYIELMSVWDRPALDITPAYCLLDDAQVEKLRDGLPEGSRVVYIVRDPLDRLESQMKLHFYMNGHYRGVAPPAVLAKFLSDPGQLRRGDYAAVIQRWSRAFGDRFEFFEYDDLVQDPKAFLRSIARHLDLDVDENVTDLSASAFYHTDSNQPLASVLPTTGRAQQLPMARALEPLVARFAESFPDTGKPWLSRLNKIVSVSSKPGVANPDYGENVAQLMRMTENLGDNCEFGFWQRHGGYEPSSLFRWAITPTSSLLEFLRKPTEMYHEDALSPHSPGMVTDATFGFKFHSKLVERVDGASLRLLSDLDERLRLYEAEKAKIDYLQRKFFVQLKADPCLYVIKRNQGISEDDVVAILELLRDQRSNHQLLWVTQGESHEVREVRPGLWTGEVERFAPYVQADNYAPGGWTRLMTSMSEQPPITALMQGMFR